MPKIAPSLKSAMFSAFVQQGVIIVLAGMILDGGVIAQMCCYAFAAFWIGVALILFRRAATPTRLDLLLIRGGYLLLCIISFFLTEAFGAGEDSDSHLRI